MNDIDTSVPSGAPGGRPSPGELAGRTAVVTGAAQGIGREVALLLAESGAAHLILLDRDAGRLETVVKDVGDLGARVTALPLDLRERDRVRTELRAALRSAGKLDILVNNAGVADENAPDDESTWLRVLDVNLHGTFAVTAACLEHLVDKGRIVNVSSILGKAGKMRNTAYCASKHGLIGYTKGLALDLASRGITVNAVLPGWIDTPMLRRELAASADEIGADPARMLRQARKSIPLRRLVEAREAADLIGFLVSDRAAAITAQSLTVDGGYTRGM
ncbi:SDR family NAD(P)-dependent oxidoreductase [Streptomyces sp. GS7]|uniref:SDR family NAD(P)-dependent oxidoreductase n=1 Tax=Streptomyces sp. GS7 TaxID=2692234 RepID=UPI001317553C|nr:SDR family NAD(P)-dependent oxidoreductase [Streptomyces sp. GS7]QHC26093.1 SDR family oxidoreductase [Streptomyces sp. GS7]